MKAVALLSGGIDSILSIKIIQEQNIEVEAVNIKIGFEPRNNYSILKEICKQLNIKLTIIDDTENFIKKILFSARYGYGRGLNPCVDCHANFIIKAWEYAQKNNAQFIISGEVLGQRGMSQTKEQIKKVDKIIGNIRHYLVRPLSAKHFPPTIPEQKKWIDRDKLLDISGKSKKYQFFLLQKYSIKTFLSIAGCRLTEKTFSRKLIFFNENYKFRPSDLPLLSTGRHFNINNKLLIIARNEKENNLLFNNKNPKFFLIQTTIRKSPVGLIDKHASKKDKIIAGKILLSYAKPEKYENKYVKINELLFSVRPCDEKYRIKYLIQ